MSGGHRGEALDACYSPCGHRSARTWAACPCVVGAIGSQQEDGHEVSGLSPGPPGSPTGPGPAPAPRSSRRPSGGKALPAPSNETKEAAGAPHPAPATGQWKPAPTVQAAGTAASPLDRVWEERGSWAPPGVLRGGAELRTDVGDPTEMASRTGCSRSNV